MITPRAVSWWLLAFTACLVALAIAGADDGMAACQISHSFDTCHASLH